MNHTTWPPFISDHAALAAGSDIFQREGKIYRVGQWLLKSVREYTSSANLEQKMIF